MTTQPFENTMIADGFLAAAPYQHFPADAFPWMNPVHWLHSHFAVGGWSPLNRLSGMLTAHMTQIAPRNGFTWHPHRGLEIYTWVLEGTLYHEDTTGGKGEIGAGEIQRMFSGQWIEHQELNLYDDPARVIQIWFVADYAHRDLAPHYQQVGQGALPSDTHDDRAETWQLIGGGSPLEQHMQGRLTATTVQPGGRATVAAPRDGEDLFLYVTDGAGEALHADGADALGQYDVIVGTPELGDVQLTAGDDKLHYLSFYLPAFVLVK